MQIIITTLLAMTLLLMNFVEIEAPRRKGEGSSSPSPKKRKVPNLERTVERTLMYKGVLPIKVWVDPRGSRSKVVHADIDNNLTPSGHCYNTDKFVTRILDIEGLKLVEYVKSDGELMGVRPRNLNVKVRPDIYEPDDSKWFITTEGCTFKVIGNSAAVEPREICLSPENLLLKAEFMNGPFIREKANMLGVYFLIIKYEPTGEIIGAELDPEYYGRNRQMRNN